MVKADAYPDGELYDPLKDFAPDMGAASKPKAPPPDRRKLFPLDTAGMPDVAGPDFARLAAQLCDDEPPKLVTRGMDAATKAAAIEQHVQAMATWAHDNERHITDLYGAALFDEGFTLPVNVKGRRVDARFVSGTTYGAQVDRAKKDDYGPVKPYDVMVISKYPGADETQYLINFVGGSSEPLFRAFRDLKMADIQRTQVGEGFDERYQVHIEDAGEVADWYFTNICKHQGLDPSTTSLPAAWLNNSAPLLAQELRLCCPRFILCLGTEATKAILGKKATVGRMFGRVVDKPIALHREGTPPEDQVWHTAKVMACVHPSYVSKKPEAYSDLVNGLAAFRQLINGDREGEVETGLHHVCVYTERNLKRIVDKIIRESTGSDVIAVDAEWHGSLPGDPGAYLRTVQFSHKHKHAYCVVLHKQGGVPAFEGGVDAAFDQLRRLLKSTPERKVRVGGHFFRADLPWLLHHDLDLRDEYAVAKSPARGMKANTGAKDLKKGKSPIVSQEAVILYFLGLNLFGQLSASPVTPLSLRQPPTRLDQLITPGGDLGMSCRDPSQDPLHLGSIEERVGVQVEGDSQPPRVFGGPQPALRRPAERRAVVARAPFKDAEEIGDDLPWALDWDRGVEAFGEVALAEFGEQAVDQDKAAVELLSALHPDRRKGLRQDRGRCHRWLRCPQRAE